MSLRKRTFLTVAAVLLAFMSVCFLFSWLVLRDTFTRFEERITLRNVERAVLTLENEQASLEATARDWGAWDDAYNYVQDLNGAYPAENLTVQALMNLRLSFVVFLDASGRKLAGKGVDLPTGREVPVPADLQAWLGDPLISSGEPDAGFSGWAVLPEGVALVAGSPVLKTGGAGPRRGTVVFGRILSPAEVARIGHIALLDIGLYPRGAAWLPPDVSSAAEALADGRARFVQPDGRSVIAGYAALTDLRGEPSVLVRVVMPREAYVFRQRTWLFLLGVMLFVGSTTTAITMAVLEKQVLARVTGLSRGINGVAQRQDISARLPVDGRADEIARLTDTLNEMLAALEQSERRYRSFIENFHGIVFQSKPDGTTDFCHGSIKEITGYSDKDFLSEAVAWRRIVHPEDRAQLIAAREQLTAQAPASSQTRYRIRRKDGEIKWVEDFVQSMPATDVGPAYLQGVIYDITERVKAEEALRESLKTTADIVRTIPSGLFTYRYEPPDRLLLLDANPEAERITGRSIQECRGKEFREIWLKKYADPVLESYLNVVRTGEVYENDDLHFNDDQSGPHFRIRAFRLPGNKLAVAFEDISAQKRAEAERQRLEEQLHHAQKMEAIGQLAGGVAHDFNNLLSGILGYASLLKLEAGADSTIYEAARTIEQAAERAADLTRQLLGFARRGKLQNVPVNLHDTIQEVIRLLGRTLDKNIRIGQHLRAAHPVVMGDPNQLQQVFVNLALNARDAMPAGGELTFESEIVDETNMPELFPEADRRPHVVIGVRDQGCGIAKEHLGRIFEPFFTTKEQGKGTGMGLAMVYGIVRNHGGFVRVYSEAATGATFRVYLPTSDSDVAADSNAATGQQPVHGAARILLVDDEAIIRNMGSTVLTRLGYSVVTAVNGREAVEYYRQHPHEIDLVVVDMVMPEMGGQECYRSLKGINPRIRAILSSGYGFDGKASELLDEGMMGFIQKPYRVAELSVAVAKALNCGKA